jgi:hypothetical protein
VDAVHRRLGGSYIGQPAAVELLRGTRRMSVQIVPALRH